MSDVEIHPEESSNPPVFAVLRNRGFVHLWTAQIFSQIATNTMLFVLALRLYQSTGSNTAVSGLFLVYGIPGLLFGMVAGTIVDKLENRKILLVCDIARAVIAIILSFVPTHVPLIYVLTLFNSVINQFYVPAEAPTIPYLVPKHLVVGGNSLFSFTFYSSLAIGSILAGPVLRILGPREVFWVLSMCFVIAAANVWQLPKFNELSRPITDMLKYSIPFMFERLWANIREGIVYVKRSKALTDALILLIGTQIILVLLGTLGPGFADKVMQIDVRDSSIFITGPAVLGIILGALWVGSVSNRIKPKKLINIGVVSAGTILVLVSVLVRLARASALEWILPHTIAIPIAVTLFFFLGVANSMLDVPSNGILQNEATGDLRGRVYGMLTAGVGGVGILPVVIGGLMADTLGVGKVIFMLGLLILVYGIFRVRYNKL
jgi:MFS family permease